MHNVLGSISQIENAGVHDLLVAEEIAYIGQHPANAQEEADALGKWLGTKNSRMRTRSVRH